MGVWEALRVCGWVGLGRRWERVRVLRVRVGVVVGERRKVRRARALRIMFAYVTVAGLKGLRYSEGAG